MARGVTGVLRAVKVVWREDYDLASVFERELEGIKRFEPISRRHTGLVDILQVGVHEDEGFYYYVMELADDVEKGRDIDPETYVPHTFASEMARRESIDLEGCLRDGTALAEALHHMHEHGLIHRDVKPSNVIYVEGECKLADIGLVALSGQRSFVGTEGFVPNEGPGTPAADIYSLGMVLYEMGTGKDRLDFPDVPTNLREGTDRELWTRLNKAICRACAARATDRFSSAHDMALALQGQGIPEVRRRRAAWGVAAVLGLAIGGLLYGNWINKRDVGALFAEEDAFAADDFGVGIDVEIETLPAGAEVYEGDSFLGTTPLIVEKTSGSRMSLTLRLEGYRNETVELFVGEERAKFVELERWIQPQRGERWRNSLGMEFQPRTGGHVSVRPVEANEFYEFVDTTGRAFEGEVVAHRFENENEDRFIVVVPYYDSEAFRFWLTEKDKAEGYLSAEHSYRVEPYYFGEEETEAGAPAFGEESEGEMAFLAVVAKQTYGSVFVNSNPPDAAVIFKGVEIGRTPVEIPRVKTGTVVYELRAEGYEHVIVEGEALPDELLEFQIDLEQTRAVVFGRDWKNNLGMEFVPVGDVLFSAWETRLRDYQFFCKQTGTKWKSSTGWEQKQNQPVMEVNRDEARAFCKWLTDWERKRDFIGEDHHYRLPTDLEWSRAVGLPAERGMDPASRSGRVRGVYPWGFGWPPPKGSGNYADAASAYPLGKDKVIPDYEDGIRFTAASTDLLPDSKGIHHLGGNVWEWIEDAYGGSDRKTSQMGVIRGGSWQTAIPEEILASHRQPMNPKSRLDSLGFRCVLARVEGEAELERD